jgi:hypothetical protein
MTQQARVVPLFKIRTLGSIVLEDGTLIAFANKQYYTEDKEIIARLERAAQKAEFGVFIDPNEPTIDMDAATPMERLRAEIRKELMAEQAAGKIASPQASTSAKASAQASVASTVTLQPVEQNKELNVTQPTAAELLLQKALAAKGVTGDGSAL